MMPAHDNFYDLYSKAKKIKIKWPNNARMAVALAGNLEAWTETPSAKYRRTRHVGGSNPIKEKMSTHSMIVVPPVKTITAAEPESGASYGSWINTA
jgi:hypothetical protein